MLPQRHLVAKPDGDARCIRQLILQPEDIADHLPHVAAQARNRSLAKHEGCNLLTDGSALSSSPEAAAALACRQDFAASMYTLRLGVRAQ